MLLDVDLGALVARHRARGDAVTMLLRDDPRAESFGSIGIDAQGCVRRIGRRFDLGGETRAGVYTWVNVVSARALGDAAGAARSSDTSTIGSRRGSPPGRATWSPSWRARPTASGSRSGRRASTSR